MLALPSCRVLGWTVRDVINTRMSEGPNAGKALRAIAPARYAKLSDWVRTYAKDIGRRYASELRAVLDRNDSLALTSEIGVDTTVALEAHVMKPASMLSASRKQARTAFSSPGLDIDHPVWCRARLVAKRWRETDPGGSRTIARDPSFVAAIPCSEECSGSPVDRAVPPRPLHAEPRAQATFRQPLINGLDTNGRYRIADARPPSRHRMRSRSARDSGNVDRRIMPFCYLSRRPIVIICSIVPAVNGARGSA